MSHYANLELCKFPRRGLLHTFWFIFQRQSEITNTEAAAVVGDTKIMWSREDGKKSSRVVHTHAMEYTRSRVVGKK